MQLNHITLIFILLFLLLSGCVDLQHEEEKEKIRIGDFNEFSYDLLPEDIYLDDINQTFTIDIFVKNNSTESLKIRGGPGFLGNQYLHFLFAIGDSSYSWKFDNDWPIFIIANKSMILDYMLRILEPGEMDVYSLNITLGDFQDTNVEDNERMNIWNEKTKEGTFSLDSVDIYPVNSTRVRIYIT